MPRRLLFLIAPLIILIAGLATMADRPAGAAVPVHAKTTSAALSVRSGNVAKSHSGATAASPAAILYDQYDNLSNHGLSSSVRPDNPLLTIELADDFVVPSGQTWQVDQIDVRGVAPFPGPSSFDAHFYTDSAGLPGTLVAEQTNRPVGGTIPDYQVSLSPLVRLPAGTYWVSVQGHISNTNWAWWARTVTTSNGTAYRNPGNGYGTGCIDWGRLSTCVGIADWEDQMFRLNGNLRPPKHIPVAGDLDQRARGRFIGQSSTHRCSGRAEGRKPLTEKWRYHCIPTTRQRDFPPCARA